MIGGAHLYRGITLEGSDFAVIKGKYSLFARWITTCGNNFHSDARREMTRNIILCGGILVCVLMVVWFRFLHEGLDVYVSSILNGDMTDRLTFSPKPLCSTEEQLYLFSVLSPVGDTAGHPCEFFFRFLTHCTASGLTI